MSLKWFVKNEPVILGGILSGIGVFFGVRYGSHSTAALQGSLGVGSASFVSFLSRFVGPSAASDVQGIANDVASLKEQLAPLAKLNGWQNAVAWLHSNGKQVVSIVEAAKTDVEDLIHQPTVSDAKPTTVAAPIAMTVPEPTVPVSDATASGGNIVNVPMTVSEASTPVAEPASQSQQDAVAELATLVP